MIPGLREGQCANGAILWRFAGSTRLANGRNLRPERDALLLQISFGDLRCLNRGHWLRWRRIELNHHPAISLAAVHHVEDGGNVDFAFADRAVAEIVFAPHVVLE